MLFVRHKSVDVQYLQNIVHLRLNLLKTSWLYIQFAGYYKTIHRYHKQCKESIKPFTILGEANLFQMQVTIFISIQTMSLRIQALSQDVAPHDKHMYSYSNKISKMQESVFVAECLF